MNPADVTPAMAAYSQAMDERQEATVAGLDALLAAFDAAIAKCMPKPPTDAQA